MGKTFAAAKGEVAKCAMTMRYYAEHAEAMLRDESVSTTGSRSGIRYDPIGAVLGGDAVELSALAVHPRRRARPSWRATSWS